MSVLRKREGQYYWTSVAELRDVFFIMAQGHYPEFVRELRGRAFSTFRRVVTLMHPKVMEVYHRGLEGAKNFRIGPRTLTSAVLENAELMSWKVQLRAQDVLLRMRLCFHHFRFRAIHTSTS